MSEQQEPNEMQQQYDTAQKTIKQKRSEFNNIIWDIQDAYVAKAGDLKEDEIQALKQDIDNHCEEYRQLTWVVLEGDSVGSMAMGSISVDDAEYRLKEICKRYPECQRIKPVATDWYNALNQSETVTKQMDEYVAPDEPVPDTSDQMSIIMQEIDKQVKEAIPPEGTTSEGHVYPVAMVKSWTCQLKSYNTQLKGFLEDFDKISLQNVDKTWLRKQLKRFSDWINDKLKKLRQKIINGLKAMVAPFKKVLNILKAIIEPPSPDPFAIVQWIIDLIKIPTEPYQTIITFLTDVATYTPPLISEAGTLIGTVAEVPGKIDSKVSQLEGEGADLVAEEIANCVGDIKMESISMGDIM